ncbi:MAG: nucleoside phosphorylase [Flavobacteriaceae bacterium]|nr:nucleoside phosphorylase [Flavobacteriaceae bacterium]
MAIAPSELVLNPDGSVYHLNLKPENISDLIIFVGDQNRVARISDLFDSIEFKTQKREFKTHTGYYKGKRISVISTGIGPDNIDIVMNELDALVNIDLKTRLPKESHTKLKIIRIGTSGSLQEDVPVDSFLMSTHGIDMTGLMHFYQVHPEDHLEAMENAFVAHTQWHPQKAHPYIFMAGEALMALFSETKNLHRGITATAGGFYGPQGRVLRLTLSDPDLNDKLETFAYETHKITNFEMETAAIYALARLLGHEAVSMNAIIANRPAGTFSANPYAVVDNLIVFTLENLVKID